MPRADRKAGASFEFSGWAFDGINLSKFRSNAALENMFPCPMHLVQFPRVIFMDYLRIWVFLSFIGACWRARMFGQTVFEQGHPMARTIADLAISQTVFSQPKVDLQLPNGRC